MGSAVSIPKSPGSSTTMPIETTVLVNGSPDPTLSVVELRAAGPLDRRSAILTADSSLCITQQTDRRLLQSYLGKDVTVAWIFATPTRGSFLIDYVSGPIVRVEVNVRPDAVATLLYVAEHELASRAEYRDGAGWLRSDGSVGYSPESAVFQIDPPGNMSETKGVVNGATTAVLGSKNSSRWTLADILAYVSARYRVAWSTGLLDRDITASPSLQDLDGAGSPGELLNRIAERFGLILRVESDPMQHQNNLSWRPVERGPSRSVSGLATGVPKMRVEKLVSDLGDEPANLLIVRGRHRREGTFDLQHGWNPSGEGLSSSEYDRDTSSDFTNVKHVYRYWVLNEDGAFSGAPFEQAEFDSRAFFDDRLEPQRPMRLEPMLTEATPGSTSDSLIEYSLDGGSVWRVFEGHVLFDDNRAALHILEGKLPAGFADAGNAGLLRLRITASLTANRPVERSRLLGNPLAPRHRTRVIELRDDTGIADVGESSQFYQDVRDGIRSATERNDVSLMDRLLVEQMRIPVETSRSELVLGPVDPSINVGDRISRFVGVGWEVDLTATGTRSPRITEVRHLLDHRQQTIVRLVS